MLKRLLIRNVALIDELTLSLADGLNVLSGETGSGKSIIVDSVSFLLGGRADRGIVREGAPKAYVEGAFSVRENAAAHEQLTALSLEAEDDELLLSRELSAVGKSVCRVDGVVVSLGALRQLAETLMDIHGQHEHQSLLNERSHMQFLDEMGDEAHRHLLMATRELWVQYTDKHRAYRELKRQQEHSQERTAMLTAKQKDLAAARVQLGEEEQLRKRVEHLRSYDKISRQLKAAYTASYDSRGDDPAALPLIRRAEEALRTIADLDESYGTLYKRAEALYYELEDLGLELRAAWDDLDADEGALQQTAERLDLIRRLSRKYTLTADEMPQALSDTKDELARMANLDDELLSLDADRQAALSSWQASANKLTAAREALAKDLGERLERELHDLNMKGTKVAILVEKREQGPDASGQDQVRIMISPNVGEELKPLTKIASGGEISRLMLALKSISAEHNVVPAMIFDEIDTGISGRTAQVVAEKLWQIARYRQVFCVTHLQQIAAMGSVQYLVDKRASDSRTITTVERLDAEERLQEISRIISGRSAGSASSLAHAEVLLKEAERFRTANPKAQ